MFEQYSSALHQRYPGITIEGDNYPPTILKYYLAQFLSSAKIIFILCIISNTNPFPWFGMETPSIVTSAFENKVGQLQYSLLCRTYIRLIHQYYSHHVYVRELVHHSVCQHGFTIELTHSIVLTAY